jgi:CHAT domain-containing protein
MRAAGVVLALFPLVSMSAECDRMLADRAALLERTVEVRGGERVRQRLHLAAGTSVLVFAVEQNLDITLEIMDSSGQRVALADNPLQRSGTQRAVIAPRSSGDYSLELVGKERPDVRGRVKLRVVNLAAADDACVKLQQTLASADTDYAVGESVTSGTSNDPNAKADTSYKSAARGYRSVATTLASSAPSPLLAESQQALASVTYLGLFDYAEAEAEARAAEQTYMTLKDSYGRARAQALQAASLLELPFAPGFASSADASTRTNEMLTRARSLLESVAAFHAQRGERYEQARALNDIALTYYQGANAEQAITVYQRALAIFDSLHNSLWSTTVMQNVAAAELQLGRASSAAARYRKLLKVISPTESAYLYQATLNNAALSNLYSGNLDAALEQYGAALDFARTRQFKTEEARALHGLGAVYYALGDRDLALAFYRQALAFSPPGSDGVARMALLRVIGNIAGERGDSDEALRLHREALQLGSNATRAANTRIQIARDLDKLGRKDEALKELATVLTQPSVGELPRATALLERSRLRMTDADADAHALEADLNSALQTFRELESPAQSLETWLQLAQLRRQHGEWQQALAAVDQALGLAEELRVQSANPELRAGLMQPLRPAFDLKVALLADRYFDARNAARDEAGAMQALMTSEQARARALSDFQTLDTSGSHVPPEQEQRRLTLYKELAARRSQLEIRLDRSGSNDPRALAVRREITTLRQQLDTLNSEIAAAGLRSHAKEQSAARKPIEKKSVPADSGIVEYWLGAEDAFAWVLTRESLSFVRLGSTAQIEDAARELHNSLRNFGSVPLADRLKAAERLHALVIQPVLPSLAGKKTLVFAPDGALHYVPFAALRGTGADGRAAFLIESHDVAVSPSVGTLLDGGDAPARASQPEGRMLLVDDPVYGRDDARFKPAKTVANASKRPPLLPFALLRGGPHEDAFARLPGTAREAAAIAALLPKGQVDQLEGFAATKDRFLSADLGRYRFIHVASHAVADAEIPQLSALILSTHDKDGNPLDSRVLAADLLNRRLNAEVIVLSACDTALGKNISGEGLMGLRYVVLARGARSVLSSLWEVPDAVAAQTMTRFYTALLRMNLPTVAASSKALRETLSGQYNDPALWAAFALTVSRISN